MMTLRVFEAFAGYGSQSLALEQLNLPHQIVGISEIDPNALIAYQILHPNVMNYGDITQINPHDLPSFDLLTYSFPCQDLSIGGQQKGLERGKTRSGLLYECEKLIEAKRPRYLLLENVKNLVSQKFKPQFDEWLAYLESLGYTNYWRVLNAKDYGVPQNRERVFVVSILGDHSPFEFPATKPFINLTDYLNLTPFDPQQPIQVHPHIKPCVARHFERDKDLMKSSGKDIFACSCTSGWQDNKVGLELTPTLRANNAYTCILDGNLIRRITPYEAFRLMGVPHESILKIQPLLSESAQYKCAGNSIVVDVLVEIFRKLLMT